MDKESTKWIRFLGGKNLLLHINYPLSNCCNYLFIQHCFIYL